MHFAVDVLDHGSDKKDITLTYDPAPNSFFPVGVTTVNVTARDKAGNVATDSFRIVLAYRPEGGDEDSDEGKKDDKR